MLFSIHFAFVYIFTSWFYIRILITTLYYFYTGIYYYKHLKTNIKFYRH